MALQINTALTTRSGFNVPSGSYCWLQEERAKDNKYSVRIELVFFKDKATFDLGRARFTPQEIPDSKLAYYQLFTPQDFAALTSTTIHNFVKAQLTPIVGDVISIVA